MVKGFIVYTDYTTIDNQNYIQLFGRLETNESFVTLSKFEPYFFIKQENEKKAEKILKKYKCRVEKTNFQTFNQEKTLKIISENQEIQNKLTKEIHENEINTFEADIKPYNRFMMDKDILSTIEVTGDYESSEKINRIYKNPEINSCKYSEKIKLKVISIDIETNKESNQLFCIGIYSNNYKKNLMITDKKLKDTISCKNEEECLEKFKQILNELDPDIITGWNLIDFDFNYLKKLFEKYRIKFDLGRSNENARIRIEENFFRNSSMDIPGRLVIDGLSFIKDPTIQEAPIIKSKKFDSYTLEDVSQAFLGKGKLISSKNRHNEIEELYKKDQQKLVDYNLMDCILAYEILEKSKMLELSMERSELTGLQIDKLNGSIASFDSLYIREAHKHNLISPSTKFTDKQERIKGGFVMSPKAGLYHNVLVLDFKSLYPSLIKTFNIDPSSFLIKKEKNCIEAPNKACFKNTDGILPTIIERLHQAREKAKQEKRELASYSIKIIMNSFFGVLASPNCRYFNLDIANAITNFGQEIIKLTTKKVEELGYEVIYGDTDSIFVHTKLTKEKAENLGKEISNIIDKFYEDYVEKNYNRKSYLDLEFDKLYLSLIMPQIRIKEKKTEEKNKDKKQNKDQEKEKEARGAKKRYAGLVYDNGKEELDIVGLEAIRGDWTDAAQEFQKELLLKVFKNENPISFIKNFVKQLKEGRFNKQLIYRKSIRKELNEYTKTTPPHVKAARQLDELEGNIIEYYITTEGPEPIQKLKHKLDYEHYIDKQIKPIAKTILETLGINFEEALSGNKQKTLF